MSKVQDEKQAVEKGAKQRAHEDRERVTDATMTALGETVCHKGETWWQTYYLIAALGASDVGALVDDATVLQASAGMLVADGSRQRTLGGVFFQLTKARAERKVWLRVVTLATYTWARRWVRKLDAKGILPTAPEGLRAVLAVHGDVASERGERVFFELVAKRATKKDTVAEVVAREGLTGVNLCQTKATTPESREALASIIGAAIKLAREMPAERFEAKLGAKPSRFRRPEQGRGGQRRPITMPPVEVLQARPRRGT